MSNKFTFSIEKNIPNNLKLNEKFIEFVKIYYDNMYQTDDFKKLEYIERYIKGEGNLIDFIELIKSEIGVNVPISDFFTNGDLVVKMLAHLKASRGTEQSIRTFFRLLFNKDVLVTYPTDVLFKTSNTKNIIVDVMLVKTTTEPKETVGKIKTYISNIECDVEKTSTIKNGSFYYTLVEFYNSNNVDLFINERVDLILKDSIFIEGVNFGTDEPVIVNGGQYYKVGDIVSVNDCVINGEYTVSAIDGGYVEELTILDGGSDYVVGDVVLTKPNNGFYAKVSNVDSNGSITQILIKNKGERYTEKPKVYVLSSNGQSANIDCVTVNVGTVKTLKCNSPSIIKNSDSVVLYSSDGVGLSVTLQKKPKYTKRYFLNNNHLLGFNNQILDSANLHEQSYTIITDVDLILWFQYYKDIMHRSGHVFKHIMPLNIDIQLQPTLTIEGGNNGTFVTQY